MSVRSRRGSAPISPPSQEIDEGSHQDYSRNSKRDKEECCGDPVWGGAKCLLSAGTWHTSVVEATVRLRKEAENGASRALGSRALVIHVGAHAAGSKPGMEAHLQCRRPAVVSTLADLRAGQAKEASLPSSLGLLSSSGSIAARPPATQIGGRPAPGSCLFHARW